MKLTCFSLAAISLSLAAGSLPLQKRSQNQQHENQPHEDANSIKPNGLVVVIANDPAKPLDLSPISNSDISGVALQIHWSDIEPDDPTKSPPDWSRIDAVMDAAAKENKWVQLLIFPGFFSPAWALKGVEQDVFPLQYGPGHGELKPLPMPWDPVYLKRWSGFVKRLSAKYGTNEALRVVSAVGPTSVSAEFTLPESPADMVLWMKHKYTPTKYEAAWKQVFQIYATDLPQKFISLSLGSGIRINDKGQKGPRMPRVVQKAVVDQAASTLGAKFVLQESNLDGVPASATAWATTFVLGYTGKAVTGFQLRTSCLKASANMGAAKDPQLAMTRSFDNGIQPGPSGQHVNYIEVYSPDVVPTMQKALDYGAALFTAKNPKLPILRKRPLSTSTPPK